MIWKVELSETAKKQLNKLNQKTKNDILRYLQERIATSKDPRRFGDPLRRQLAGFWKYRIGDYRVVCDIQDKKILVLVLRAGHRSKVYSKKE